jgi:ABC-2 type transport system ATP-binding protein
VIEMRNITKYYDNFRALNDFNLKVEKGEILGLLGPNGAGKTTAMRILTCFLPATSGSASVAGFDIFDDSIEVRRRLGYLPETPPLYPEMRVGSYLNFVGEIRELPKKVRKERVGYVVERIGLSNYENRLINTLSKGYRQRVGLAQALLHNPEVLILDEPTVGLDPNQIIEIRNLIKDLAQDHTIILSTHILTEVSMTCGRVVIINEGEIAAVDSVENLEKNASGMPTWRIVMKPAQDLDWHKEIEKIPSAEVFDNEGGDIAQFKLRLAKAEKFDEVFTKLAGKGCLFREITPIKATLEDVFLKITHGEERSNQ